MRYYWIAVFAALFVATFSAQAQRIAGRVVVTNELREFLDESEKKEAEAKKLYYWNEPNGIADVRLPSVNPQKDLAVVVNLEGGKPPKPNNVETVKILAGALEKNVIVTRPGSTIRFKNVNPFEHALYSPTLPSFKPENQTNGAVRTVEFSEEGIFEIKCKLVPHFKAHVVVTKATYIAPLNGDGTFALNEIEPGKYLLRVFHRGEWIHSQRVEVGGDSPWEAKLAIALKPKAAPSKGKAKGEKKESGTK